MKSLVESFPIWASIILGAMWINAFAAHRMLLKIERERPEVLAAVGITKVDWWLRCLRGIAVLALTSKGQALHQGERWVLRGVVMMYVFLIVSGVSMLVGM
ncbi:MULTISPECIES: hypothetical protein [Stenotrophomonas]|uniref:hypothetical protein n=1 Tax=Stenotrophomonas TaxID=40323 RepID=UPI001D102D2A|nr:hypothetical protein [[Pseudomonas] hibiscicola]UXB17021.1 hypothetical protein K7565_05065 [Stenotrophomonas maltophilia]